MIYVYADLSWSKDRLLDFSTEFICVTGSNFCLDFSRLRFEFEVVWPAPQVDVKKIERYTAF